MTTTQPRSGPAWTAWTSGLGLAVLVGLPGTFVAFLFAYGFRDVPTPGQHVAFLVMYAGVAAVATLATWPVLAAALRYGARRGLAGSAAVVASAYSAALAAGTVVSLLAEGQGSVTADQPDWPFVLLVVGAAALAYGCTVAARRLLSLPG